MKLRIKPFDDRAKTLYENHAHFHSGDAGLDLFVVEDQIIPANSTTPIPLRIACENIDNKAYYLLSPIRPLAEPVPTRQSPVFMCPEFPR